MENVQAQYDQAVAEARNLFDRISAQARREERNITDSEQQTIRAATERATALQRRLGESRNNLTLRSEIDRLTGGMTGDGAIGGRSLGAQFGVPFDKWRRENPYRRDANWGSPAYEIHATTLTEGAGSGGAVVVPDHRPGIVPLPMLLPTVASLLSDGDTTSNAVSYPREKTFTNAAATVAEGNAKPESGLVFEQVTDPVTKIAHWLPVTEELLEDAPALAAYINTRLELGVQLTEDDQLLNGNGVAPNILGLLARPGLAADLPRGTDTNADAIAKQMAAIQTSTNLVATGVIMHPTNWLTTQLAKDTTGQYVGGTGPFALPQVPTLWGRPVAVTKAIAVGKALIICRFAAMVLKRSPLTVAATNSHQDFFIKNLVAIRAEQREALAVMIPGAFGTVSGLN